MEYSVKKSRIEMYRVIDNFMRKFLSGFKSRLASISSSQIYRKLHQKSKISAYLINQYLRNLEEICDNKNRRWKVIGREYRRNGTRITLKKID